MPSETDGIFYPKGGGIAIVGGEVVPTGGERLTPSEISKQIRDVVAMPYGGKNAACIGMTLLEAALYETAVKAANGDTDALSRLLDRLMGKPVQQTITATGTLADFLSQIARSDGKEVAGGADNRAAIDIDALGL